MVNAFLAAALAATGHFCFASVASGSVVLVLPGYLFLAGSLGEFLLLVIIGEPSNRRRTG